MHLSDIMNNYVSEKEFEHRSKSQKQFALEYLKILDEMESDRELPREIEFFFYTDAKTKAKDLKNDLKEMGYDAVALGNHEFDFGVNSLAGYVIKANELGSPPLLSSSS